MIIDEIVLHNFGIYCGRQAFSLTPRTNKKSITLLGGLNGDGKTTVLDAMLLALYGKLAPCSNRGQLSYTDFLRRCIHRGVSQSDGAAVEVEFRHVTEGREYTYRVHRSWRSTGKGMREHIEVLRDNRTNQLLTERWAEHVEQLLPVRIANLFFFDGEKITAYTDPDTSAGLLSTAIHSLLGLDLVDRLKSDLVALERRKKIHALDEAERKQLDAIAQSIKETDLNRQKLLQQRASTTNTLDRLKKDLEDVEGQFQLEGGSLYEQRTEIETDKTRIVGELSAAEEQIQDLAYGAAPLYLVPDLLEELADQVQKEQGTRDAQLLSALLEKRDAALIKHMAKIKAAKKVQTSLKTYLRKDRDKRMAEAVVEPYIEMTPEGAETLRSLLSTEQSLTRDLCLAQLNRLQQLRRELEDADRRLAAIPDQAAIASLIAKREGLLQDILQAESRIKQLDERIGQHEREQEAEKAKLTRALEKLAKEEFKKREKDRLLDHSAQVRQTLDKFREAVVERHVRKLEGLILDSFQQLVRKSSLVARLTIDPATFEISIYTSTGEHRSLERLSQGERQLLAISILWGLGRASGRRLPVIIDTPLGRLDSEHRTNLVTRYFPFASHQVVLLSTDEEIDEIYFKKLKPFIGRTYRLEFGDNNQSTHIHPGYFWEVA